LIDSREEERTNLVTTMEQPAARISRPRVALTAGIGLLLMAVLAPFAYFFVLQALVDPADAAATVDNITTSEGLFRIGIAAWLVVIALDVVVAWALYVLFRPVNETLALLVAWLRLVYTAIFAIAVANLFDVAQALGGQRAALGSEQLQAEVMASIASFENGWDIGLAIFGLHLLGLGVLLFGSTAFSRVLGVLVMVAGGGYLVDSLGEILVPGYAVSLAVFTFVGEVLLIGWLFWVAIKEFRPGS
jgi:hypothetical protein